MSRQLELPLGGRYCASRTNCGTSSGKQWCGCDGLSYPNVQSACFAGARIAGEGACGQPYLEGAGGSFAGKLVTTCSTDTDCADNADGNACCALTGRCYDKAHPIACTEPPPGSERACLDNSDCLNDEFCAGEGCGTPGGCQLPSAEDCTGLLEPVCGCDGNDYTNAGCAFAAGVRIAQSHQCTPDATP